jgi:hypothetical protein
MPPEKSAIVLAHLYTFGPSKLGQTKARRASRTSKTGLAQESEQARCAQVEEPLLEIGHGLQPSLGSHTI